MKIGRTPFPRYPVPAAAPPRPLVGPVRSTPVRPLVEPLRRRRPSPTAAGPAAPPVVVDDLEVLGRLVRPLTWLSWVGIGYLVLRLALPLLGR